MPDLICGKTPSGKLVNLACTEDGKLIVGAGEGGAAPLSGGQFEAVTGTPDQTAVATDPAAAGETALSLLRGILAEMQAQTALLTTIATNTTPTP